MTHYVKYFCDDNNDGDGNRNGNKNGAQLTAEEACLNLKSFLSLSAEMIDPYTC